MHTEKQFFHPDPFEGLSATARPLFVPFPSLRDTLLNLAEQVGGKKLRQNGSTVLSHYIEVADLTASMLQPAYQEVGWLQALVHDIGEDIKNGLLVLTKAISGYLNAPRILFSTERITNPGGIVTYKSYTEDLVDVGDPSDPTYPDKIIVLVEKLADRISNTSKKERLDKRIVRNDYTNFCRELGDPNSLEAQKKLLAFYKKTEVIYVNHDVHGKKIIWYDRNGQLKIDKNLFVRAAEARFEIKKIDNARDNRTFFIEKFEEVLLNNPHTESIIDKDAVRKNLSYLAITSIEILREKKRFNFSSEMAHFAYRLKNRELEYKGFLNLLPSLFVADRFFKHNLNEVKKNLSIRPWNEYQPAIAVKDIPVIFSPTDAPEAFIPTKKKSYTFGERNIDSSVDLKSVVNLEDPINEKARKIAIALHGKDKRRTGKSQETHLEEHVRIVEKIFPEENREILVAVAWLHDIIDTDFDWEASLRTVFHTPPTTQEESLINILRLLARQEGETYVQYTERISAIERNNPTHDKCAAAIAKVTERYLKFKDLQDLSDDEIYETAIEEWNILAENGYSQNALAQFYANTGFVYITEDIAGNPIDIYDEKGNFIAIDRETVLRSALRAHSARLISLAHEATRQLLPNIEERALYALPSECNRDGHGIFLHTELWNFCWTYYTACFEELEKYGQGGKAHIYELMRERQFRDRYEAIKEHLGYYPILHQMWLLYTAHINGLADQHGNAISEDAWEYPRPPMTEEEFDRILQPKGPFDSLKAPTLKEP